MSFAFARICDLSNKGLGKTSRDLMKLGNSAPSLGWGHLCSENPTGNKALD